MNRKLTERTYNVTRKTNAFGWLKRRGGAGAVAAGLALAIVLVSLSVTVTAYRPASSTAYQDEPVTPVVPDDVIPWEKPTPTEAPAPHGAMPTRLPC